MKAAINGFDMNYEVAGDARAPAVVLHHPLATNLGTWDDLAARLSPRYRVIRFDARGHGKSEAPKGPYALADLAKDVVALMDHLGVAKARFLGLSMGGMVGQHLGLDHADRFDALSLVSTSSRIPPEAKPIWIDRITNTPKTGMAGTIDAALARWVAPKVLQSDPKLVARLKQMILSTPVDGYVGWCHAISALDVTDRLPRIKLPTQVVVGALDPATPPAAAEVIHRQIKGSSLVVMPGVSHMLQEEDPAAFAAHVLPFFAAHGPTG